MSTAQERFEAWYWGETRRGVTEAEMVRAAYLAADAAGYARGRGEAACATCLWWNEEDPQYQSPRSGICSGNRTHDLGSIIAVEGGKRGPSAKPIQTSEFFGCNRHEAIPQGQGPATKETTDDRG